MPFRQPGMLLPDGGWMRRHGGLALSRPLPGYPSHGLGGEDGGGQDVRAPTWTGPVTIQSFSSYNGLKRDR